MCVDVLWAVSSDAGSTPATSTQAPFETKLRAEPITAKSERRSRVEPEEKKVSNYARTGQAKKNPNEVYSMMKIDFFLLGICITMYIY